MIVKIEAEIIGSFLIEKDMKIKHYPLDIDLRFDKETQKFYISLSKRILNYGSFIPKLKINEQKVSAIEFPSQSFLEEEIKILQHIESFGAIDKGIEKIDWQHFSIEWIPETKNEENELPIKKYKRDLSYDSETKLMSKDWLTNTIIFRRQLSHLALPFSFLREGTNFYHNFQYQNAFINFYFMLEGFFGNGKDYRNEKMKSEFANSYIMDYAIDETIMYLAKTNDKHYQWFIDTCRIYNKQADKEGLIHILVEKRGKLSHFSLKDAGKQKNPFNDSEYHSLAFITMMICRYSSIKLRLIPFQRNESAIES
jgi:hypothetical protein